LEGLEKKSPIQLRRDPEQPVDQEIAEFYERLLAALREEALRRGNWKLLTTRAAWIGNETCHSILGQAYDHNDEHVRIFVNWSDLRAQCYADIGLGMLNDCEVVLRDQIGPKKYVRQGLELMMRGLYLDLDPWEAQVFSCEVRTVRAMAE
jgi:hypothetical protein